MTKRRPPTEKRDWARIVNREWRLNLATGEALTPVRELSKGEAKVLAETLPVYYFGYLIPVRQLTGDSTAIARELAQSASDASDPEYNEFHLFRGDRGTDAVIVVHQH